jgi:8-amino-7-oxononanoate synthase
MAAAAQASFEIIEEEPERVKKLQANVEHISKGLRECGFNTLKSQTPIIPIILEDNELTYRMAKLSQQQGIYVLPIVAPAVPVGTSRIRACVTAGHTHDDIEKAIRVFRSVGEALKIIPGK